MLDVKEFIRRAVIATELRSYHEQFSKFLQINLEGNNNVKPNDIVECFSKFFKVYDMENDSLRKAGELNPTALYVYYARCEAMKIYYEVCSFTWNSICNANGKLKLDKYLAKVRDILNIRVDNQIAEVTKLHEEALDD